MPQVDAVAIQRRTERLDKSLAAAHRLDREATPELEAPVHFEGLASPDRREPHTMARHPQQGFIAAGDKRVRQFGIAPVVGNAAQVCVELVFGVGAEIGHLDFGIGEVGHQCAQVVDAVVGEADCAGREAAVPASLGLGCSFEDEHPGASLVCRERCAHRGIAGPDHHDVVVLRSLGHRRGFWLTHAGRAYVGHLDGARW